ncbi:MAG TPA: helix-turn-helix transcriptional regulator [Flavobacterium sp.]|jgi:transcriptional regulator with XRE-family HTH domain|nr:helix-turn-helix transcriptional regulator [Flavobacterium sp.]
MVNTDDFIKRLEIILDYYCLNASSFADKIGVQRSSLSHLLSGRNKPSLDFILKIMDVFPEVDLYWMLNGNGAFPKSEIQNKTNITPPTPIIFNPIEDVKIEMQSDISHENNSTVAKMLEENVLNLNSNSKITLTQKKVEEIERIVIFYTNGTFKTYSSD